MSLLLVLHELAAAPEPASKAFYEAIFEIAPEHWPITPQAVLLTTDVSPNYLRDHLLRALKQHGGEAGQLLITRCAGDSAWHRLSAEGESWLKDALEE